MTENINTNSEELSKKEAYLREIAASIVNKKDSLCIQHRAQNFLDTTSRHQKIEEAKKIWLDTVKAHSNLLSQYPALKKDAAYVFFCLLADYYGDYYEEIGRIMMIGELAFKREQLLKNPKYIQKDKMKALFRMIEAKKSEYKKRILSGAISEKLRAKDAVGFEEAITIISRDVEIPETPETDPTPTALPIKVQQKISPKDCPFAERRSTLTPLQQAEYHRVKAAALLKTGFAAEQRVSSEGLKERVRQKIEPATEATSLEETSDDDKNLLAVYWDDLPTYTPSAEYSVYDMEPEPIGILLDDEDKSEITIKEHELILNEPADVGTQLTIAASVERDVEAFFALTDNDSDVSPLDTPAEEEVPAPVAIDTHEPPSTASFGLTDLGQTPDRPTRKGFGRRIWDKFIGRD